MTARPAPTETPVRMHRPKAQLFHVLAMLWVFPSLGALLVLLLNSGRWLHAESLSALVSSTRFEQWIAVLLLLLHAAFFLLARHYHRNEIPREVQPESLDADK